MNLKSIFKYRPNFHRIRMLRLRWMSGVGVRVVRIVAAILIGLLAICLEIYALGDLFLTLDYSEEDMIYLCGILVVVLQGLGFYLGQSAQVWAGFSRAQSPGRRLAATVSVVACLGLLFALLLSMGLRWLLIQYNGGLEAFMAGDYGAENGDFLRDVFLMCVPVLVQPAPLIAGWYSKLPKNQTTAEAPAPVKAGTAEASAAMCVALMGQLMEQVADWYSKLPQEQRSPEMPASAATDENEMV